MFYFNLQQIIYLHTVPVYLPVFNDSVIQKCVVKYLFFFFSSAIGEKQLLSGEKNVSAKLVSEDLKKTVEEMLTCFKVSNILES